MRTLLAILISIVAYLVMLVVLPIWILLTGSLTILLFGGENQRKGLERV